MDAYINSNQFIEDLKSSEVWNYCTNTEYQKLVIDKYTKVYKNNDYVFNMVTIVKCSKDDEFDEKCGKRLAQLKSNVQYDRLVRYAEHKLRSRLSKALQALLDKSVKDMRIADANRAKYNAERRK